MIVALIIYMRSHTATTEQKSNPLSMSIVALLFKVQRNLQYSSWRVHLSKK